MARTSAPATDHATADAAAPEVVTRTSRQELAERAKALLSDALQFVRSHWQPIAAVLATAAIVGAGAAILGRGGGESKIDTSPSVESPSAPDVPAPTPAPDEAPPERGSDWPSGRTAYTVIVASKKTRHATAAAEERVIASGRTPGLLRSADYATLNPGYWVVFVNEFPSAKAAGKAAARLRREGFAGAYARLISAEPQEPTGTLTTTGVGPVQVGMTQDEVLRYFVPPDRKEEFNFGRGPAPQVDWTWSFPDGDLRLQFENRGTPTVTGYVSTTAALTTSSGATIGSPFAPIEQRYADQLRQSPIGGHTLLLSDGRPGTYPALSFTVIDTEIASISGGEFPAAGE